MWLMQLRADPSIQRLLKTSSFRLQNFEPVFRGRIDEEARKLFKQHFDSEGASTTGIKWQKLSLRTVRRKKNFPKPHKPLVRTGALMGSLVGNTVNTRLRIRPTSYRRGTLLPYERYHRLGLGGLPVRDPSPSPLPKSFLDKVRVILIDYIVTGRP